MADRGLSAFCRDGLLLPANALSAAATLRHASWAGGVAPYMAFPIHKEAV